MYRTFTHARCGRCLGDEMRPAAVVSRCSLLWEDLVSWLSRYFDRRWREEASRRRFGSDQQGDDPSQSRFRCLRWNNWRSMEIRLQRDQCVRSTSARSTRRDRSTVSTIQWAAETSKANKYERRRRHWFGSHRLPMYCKEMSMKRQETKNGK